MIAFRDRLLKAARHACLAVAMLLTGPAMAQGDAAPSDAELRAAFLYAYPYYEFMWLRDQALNNEQSRTYTRLNALRHQRHLATPADRWANGPINDTFYSTAWLDLSAGPVLLSLPDTADRYYVLVLIGADTNSFEYFGRRNTGTAARKVAVVGPDWQGPVPAADQVVRAPTRDVYINMRVLVRGPDDLARAHAVQDAFVITPAGGQAPEGPKLRPADGDVERMFGVVNEAIARNPPPAAEAPLLERYRPLGLCGAACRWSDLAPGLQTRWRALVPPLVARLKTALDASRADVKRVNGWIPFRLPRSFGSNHAVRAGSAANSGGIFGVEAAEATYFMGVADEHDEPLGQGRRYRLRLPAGGLPADAFWSITLYEFVGNGNHYLYANPLGRYAIGDRTPGLERNADGSLDIWIQPAAPEGRQASNWLPSPPANRFVLNARLYQPWPAALDPGWMPPAVERLAP